MPFVTIDIIPDRHGSRHYEVVFKRGNEVLIYWNVADEAQGQAEVLEEIRRINKRRNPDIA